MIKRLFFVILSIVFINIISAQTIINTEKLALKADSGFFFESSNSFSLEQGNSDLIQLSGSGLFGYAGKKHTYKFFGAYRFLMNNDELILSRNAAQLRHNYNFNNKYRSFAFYQIQNNSSLILSKRQLIGLGLRRKININDSLIFDFGTGIMHEFEALLSEKLKVGEKDTYKLFRMSNVLSINYIINKYVGLSNSIYYQPDIRNFSDFRFFNELSMQFLISKYFSIELSFIYRYDSKPPEALKKRDYNFGTGIVFKI